VKICDFGISTLKLPHGCVGMTGTPGYMAPEVFMHDDSAEREAISTTTSAPVTATATTTNGEETEEKQVAPYTEKVDVFSYVDGDGVVTICCYVAVIGTASSSWTYVYNLKRILLWSC